MQLSTETPLADDGASLLARETRLRSRSKNESPVKVRGVT